MPQVVDIRSADDPRDIVHRSSQCLAEGQLLLCPTETQYTLTACGLQSQAVERLAGLANGCGLELAVRGAEDVRDYWTEAPRTAQKLARRCWPGPVVLAMSEHLVGNLFQQLPASARDRVIRNGEIHFRASAHPLWQDMQRYVPGPLVCIADSHSSETPRRALTEIPRDWQVAAGLTLDDGPCRYGDATTVVRVQENGWEIESEGVVGARHIARLAGEVFLFVCTGNTCRSPMAEAIFRKLLADRLECAESELEDRGYVVLSAGLSAGIGSPAARDAVEILAEDDINLNEHCSQPVTQRLLQQADAIFTMTRQHRQTILSGHPELESRVKTLAGSDDIPDPIGAGREVYLECKQEIERHLRRLVDQILESKA